MLGSTNPANASNGSYGMGGSLQKITEITIALAPIQMGARVYFPTLGRFASVDPVDGGTANRYVYVLDPVNGNDYSGLGVTVVMTWNTSSTLQGSTITPQTQTSNGGSQPVAIARVVSNSTPIKAPLKSGTFISKVVVTKTRIMVYPTTAGRLSAVALLGAIDLTGQIAWTEVMARAPSANTSSIRNQFFCHWDFVRYSPFKGIDKESWNLDFNQPDVGFARTVISLCNPS